MAKQQKIQPLEVLEQRGERWFIKSGFAGYNTPANNRNGYANSRSAYRAYETCLAAGLKARKAANKAKAKIYEKRIQAFEAQGMPNESAQARVEDEDLQAARAAYTRTTVIVWATNASHHSREVATFAVGPLEDAYDKALHLPDTKTALMAGESIGLMKGDTFLDKNAAQADGVQV